uniref:BED-type domain-containing protein n=1 Tax=Oryza punctata TaxID=4537 RepID=A0A0E0JY14_ORYPU
MAEENNYQLGRTGRRRRSEYWDNFEQKAECKYCKKLLCADPVRDGTSRLKKHYEETCQVRNSKPGSTQQQSSPSTSVQDGIDNLQKTQIISKSSFINSGQQKVAVVEDQLLRMIALHGSPSSLVEDEQFTSLIEILCPDFEMPSQGDIQKRCHALFDQEMNSLEDALECAPGLNLVCATPIRWFLNLIAELLHPDEEPFLDPYGEECIRAFQDDSLYRRRREISSCLKLDHPWTYNERWYAYYYALEIIQDECSSAPAQIAPLAGKIIFHETRITELLRTTLGTLYCALKKISTSNSPTSNLCLIELLKVRKTLVHECRNASRRNEDSSRELRSGPMNRSTDRDMEEENNCQQPTRRAGRRKRSEVWDHFEQKAECNYCKALLCADPARDGTSRLKKHYEETCPARHPNKSGRAGQQHGSPAASSERQGNHVLQNASTISKSTSDGQQTAAASAAAEDQLIRMIALHGFPSSMVEYVEFIRFVQMLCPDFKMLLRDDVEERCDALFDQEMSILKDAIARTPGLFSNLKPIPYRACEAEKKDRFRIREDDNDDEDTNEEQAHDIEDYDVLQSDLAETKLRMDMFFDDSYLSESIPLILDPRFKLVNVERLLKKASLPPYRIWEVQAAVVQLFQDYSNQGNARQPINHNNENVMDIDPFQQSHDSTFQTVGQSSMEHDHRNSQESITELYAYLQEKTVPIKQENFDILKWWKENCHRYPTVARMARDFLAIPVFTRPTPQMMTEITNHLRRYA